MAGLGRKEWSPGDTLNAADVNGYLMDQSVMVFAGTAARASAIPTPSAGMVAYSTATGLQVYDGSSFTPVTKVLQVVSGSTSTQASSSVTTYADTNLTATITPTSATSKVLVVVTQTGLVKTSGNANNGINLKLLRGATDIQRFGAVIGFTGTASSLYPGNAGTQFLDSPATTSATTYKTQFANDTAAAAVRVQDGGVSESTIILYEISA